MTPFKGSMAGYMGSTKAHIKRNGTGYENKALRKPPKVMKEHKRPIIPPNLKSLRTHTMNNVHNHRLGKMPIAQDTWLSNHI